MSSVPGRVIAIIPARGGSRAISGKNLVLLAGKPLLSYAIAAATGSRHVNDVIVSTDHRLIAETAERYGARTIMRPAQISGDESPSEEALIHVLAECRRGGDPDPEYVVFLQATSPLTTSADIDAALDTIRNEGADSLFSAVPLQGFVWRHAKGDLSSFNYDHRQRQRRQDAPEDLVENGAMYVFRPRVLEEHGNRLGGRIAVYRMRPASYFQLDEPGDLEVLEALVTNLAHRSTAPWENVRLLVLDFDGVLTDNRVSVDERGVESVVCDRSDGIGIGLLREAGLEVLVLSKERNPVVTARSTKLSIPCIQGCDDKLAALKAEAQRRGLAASQIAYVGNDINDLDCMGWVALPIAVADAAVDVRRIAGMITLRPGGRGAVREVADAWLASRSVVPGRHA